MQFIDLQAQRARISAEIDKNIQTVLEHGRFVMGPELIELEKELAEFGEAKYALGCGSGTDALLLPLMTWNIGPADAVFCPSFTYCATAEVVALLGATPFFVDVDPHTYNMDPTSLKQAISDVKSRSDLTAKAIIIVDLFGQAADYETLAPIAREAGLKIISDSAQGFGSTLNDKHPLHWSDATATSFFPAKPLGCYGDGGAVLTNSEEDMLAMDSMRIHGKGTDKYDNVRIGMNSRLDTLQAAILRPKLTIFPEEITLRNKIANRYIEGLKGHVEKIPTVMNGVVSTWAQFTIEVSNPNELQSKLGQNNVPSARYYPVPTHAQQAYKDFPICSDGLTVTNTIKEKVISLPMHPYLSEDDQDKVINTVIKSL